MNKKWRKNNGNYVLENFLSYNDNFLIIILLYLVIFDHGILLIYFLVKYERD